MRGVLAGVLLTSRQRGEQQYPRMPLIPVVTHEDRHPQACLHGLLMHRTVGISLRRPIRSLEHLTIIDVTHPTVCMTHAPRSPGHAAFLWSVCRWYISVKRSRVRAIAIPSNSNLATATINKATAFDYCSSCNKLRQDGPGATGSGSHQCSADAVAW